MTSLRIFKVVKIKTVVWVMIPCSSKGGFQSFGGICCDVLGTNSKWIWHNYVWAKL